jgi:hypothetical protein
MASPDKTAFDLLASRLLQYGQKVGSFFLMETAKEIIKWGFKNLLG